MSAAPGPLLETRDLGVNFGGLMAVDQVALRVDAGEIRAVIGPNGAGKTTLMGLVSGRTRPTSGRVLFRGEDITRLPPWTRVARGIVYTFQVTSVFRGLSCYDNVALAAQRTLGGGLGAVLLPETRVAARTGETLAQVGLDGFAAQRAEELSYGHQRLLELAMGLALEPSLLILDEPTQGLSQGEIAVFCDIVRAVATRATVLLIEHNMPVVLELAHRITVMERGGVLAEGSPDEIERNPEVQRAYLGR